jgi:hypothetical protein
MRKFLLGAIFVFGTGLAQLTQIPLSGGSGGTVTSVGLLGTVNQLTVTGTSPITSSGSWTLSLPSVLTLPGTVNKITLTPPTTAWTITPVADNQVTNVPAGTLVPNSVTVNGHALSSNVVVSASDITTGTLPAAQLPNAGVFTGDANTTFPALTVSAIGGKTISLANSFTTAGNFALTITTTATSNFTIPAGTHTGAITDAAQTFAGVQIFSGHITTSGSAPGAVCTGLGSGSCSVAGNDNAFEVTLSPTGSPGGTGNITITWNTSVPTVMECGNTFRNGTGTWGAGLLPLVVTTDNTTTELFVWAQTGALTAGSTYLIAFTCHAR